MPTLEVRVTDSSLPARRRHGSRALRLLVWTGLILLGIELASLLLIYSLSQWLGEPILKRSAIYRDQSEQVRWLLSAEDRRIDLHPDFGWIYRPGFRGSDTINSWGARGLREYAAPSPPHVLRVGAFGNSFVHGTEVGSTNAWTSVWEAWDATVEVVNFGVGGYGVDQAFLRYLGEQERLAAHVVIIGFSPDDLSRVVNVFRRFRSVLEPPLLKPRFRLEPDGSLTLLPAPGTDRAAYTEMLANPERVRTFGRHDSWYDGLVYANPLYDAFGTLRLASALVERLSRRYWDPDRLIADGRFRVESEAFRVQLAIFRSFADSVRSDGAIPILVFFPDRDATAAFLSHRGMVYQPLHDAAVAAGLDVLDAREALLTPAPADPASLFKAGGHYNERANARIAAWLRMELPGLLAAACSREAVESCDRISRWRAGALRTSRSPARP